MSFTIPDTIRERMKEQATASGLPYATIVGQKVYDLQGLVNVLTDELHDAQQGGDSRKIAEVTTKLKHRQAELDAYRAEQSATAS